MAAASGASVTSGLVSGAFFDARLGLAVSSTTSCSLIVSSSSAGSDFADLEVRFVAGAVVSGSLAALALLEVLLGAVSAGASGSFAGSDSTSLTGSGCLAARALLEVFLGVGAASGITSSSLTGSGSLAARALLEVLLGASLT